MTDLDHPSLQGPFNTIQRQMVQLLEYAIEATRILKDKPEFRVELRDSVIVLVVTRLEAFFNSLVSLGTRHREFAVRANLRKNGQEQARTCDLPALVQLVRARVSFEKGGRRLDNVCRLIFCTSVWPSDAVRDLVLDLVLLRNLIVHSDGSDWSQEDVRHATYATQFRCAEVLDVRRYGDFTVYSVDDYKALLFIKEAVLGVVEQLKYLEQSIVQDATWAESSE